MNAFRYQAVEGDGRSVQGVIEAEDRKSALQQLGQRGLFPANLELCATNGEVKPVAEGARGRRLEFRFGKRIKRKEITAFTREMGALLGAAIPIPQALSGLGEELSNA